MTVCQSESSYRRAVGLAWGAGGRGSFFERASLLRLSAPI